MRPRTLGFPLFALLLGFSGASQDISVDAWRIEAASNGDELGLLSSAYQLGYRFAILITDALILIMANHFGWNVGGGITMPLSGFDTFIEARYNQVQGNPGSLKFVPVTFGVMF